MVKKGIVYLIFLKGQKLIYDIRITTLLSIR